MKPIKSLATALSLSFAGVTAPGDVSAQSFPILNGTVAVGDAQKLASPLTVGGTSNAVVFTGTIDISLDSLVLDVGSSEEIAVAGNIIAPDFDLSDSEVVFYDFGQIGTSDNNIINNSAAFTVSGPSIVSNGSTVDIIDFGSNVAGTVLAIGNSYDNAVIPNGSQTITFGDFNGSAVSVTINPGVTSTIGGGGNNPNIPEPSTYVTIFGAAALGVAAMRRRHIKAQQTVPPSPDTPQV